MKEIINNILTHLGEVKLPSPSYFETLKTYTVKKVSDADTFDVISDEDNQEMTVRFVYIDTPETPKGWGDSQVEKMNRKNENQIYRSQFEWGEKGKERLQELVEKVVIKSKLKLLEKKNDQGDRHVVLVKFIY